MKENRLWFAVRADLSEGRRAAQLIHAMDLWATKYGGHDGTVIVYVVPDEKTLLGELFLRTTLSDRATDGRSNTTVSRVALFREPDLGDEATAWASDQGPFDLPLLGSKKRSDKPSWLEAS